MRLIDASSMRDDWLENGENEYVYDTNAVLDNIDSQQTVDAVPVVRCRECQWWQEDDDVGHCDNPDGLDNYAKPEDFCSYGKRKEGAD